MMCSSHVMGERCIVGEGQLMGLFSVQPCVAVLVLALLVMCIV